MEMNWHNIETVQLCSATRVDLQECSKGRHPVFEIFITIGAEIGTKASSEQLKAMYFRREPVGKQVPGMINFPPGHIGITLPECLMTRLYGEDGPTVFVVSQRNALDRARSA